ncbi:MAG: c-type cytochrome [Deltaproteobacteria bacterium]|nr:c-type cytochrome [Deltaproteobacteria bacterium]
MVASLILVLLTAQTDVARGRQLFHDGGLGRSGFSCASCHSTVADESKEGDGLLRAGHTLFGAAKRPHWRGDTRRSAYKDVGAAMDACVDVFMGTQLGAPDKRALVGFITSISPKSASPISIVPGLEASKDYKRDKYANGDPSRGRVLFFRACHSCHPGGDQGLGPALFGATSEAAAMWIREGNGLLRGKRTKDGHSPFFGRDRLSDKEVADIGAFVESLKAPGSG